MYDTWATNQTVDFWQVWLGIKYTDGGMSPLFAMAHEEVSMYFTTIFFCNKYSSTIHNYLTHVLNNYILLLQILVNCTQLSITCTQQLYHIVTSTKQLYTIIYYMYSTTLFLKVLNNCTQISITCTIFYCYTSTHLLYTTIYYMYSTIIFWYDKYSTTVDIYVLHVLNNFILLFKVLNNCTQLLQVLNNCTYYKNSTVHNCYKLNNCAKL